MKFRDSGAETKEIELRPVAYCPVCWTSIKFKLIINAQDLRSVSIELDDEEPDRELPLDWQIMEEEARCL